MAESVRRVLEWFLAQTRVHGEVAFPSLVFGANPAYALSTGSALGYTDPPDEDPFPIYVCRDVISGSFLALLIYYRVLDAVGAFDREEGTTTDERHVVRGLVTCLDWRQGVEVVRAVLARPWNTTEAPVRVRDLAGTPVAVFKVFVKEALRKRVPEGYNGQDVPPVTSPWFLKQLFVQAVGEAVGETSAAAAGTAKALTASCAVCNLLLTEPCVDCCESGVAPEGCSPMTHVACAAPPSYPHAVHTHCLTVYLCRVAEEALAVCPFCQYEC